jgi:hypothetical protein
MVDKVNGKAVADQHLTGSIQYVAISVAENITPAAFGVASQVNLDKLVETVSQRSQPVILGVPTGSVGSQIINVAFGHEDVWGTHSVGADVTALETALTAAGFTSVDAKVKAF